MHRPKVFLSGKQLRKAKKVDTKDVAKFHDIVTETPHGQMFLNKYLAKIEKDIATEVATRKYDMRMVRTQMAQNLAMNRKSRAQFKKKAMMRMAANAKAAQDHLAAMMRKTHEHFAKQTALANKRNRRNLANAKQTMKMVNQNKREAAHALKMAIGAQQRAQAAFASASNSHISQMNKKVAANAAQIKENAKKARHALEHAMQQWQHKINHFKQQSKKGLSKVAAQWASMNKRTREMANAKLHALVAHTAAQFRRVRHKMAVNRHHVDMAVKHAASRLAATLNAQKALANKRYSKTVSDIAATRAATNRALDAAKGQFKVMSLALMSTAKNQFTKIAARQRQLQATVRRNKEEQSRVNRSVHAELKRMVKLGSARERHENVALGSLKHLIQQNHAHVMHHLQTMAKRFQTRIRTLHKKMAKDRKLQSVLLKRATSKLYAALRAQTAAANAQNAKMAANTRRMRLDAMDRVRKMKEAFKSRFKRLGSAVARSQRKFQHKMDHLCHVVRVNAMKNKRGRQMLHTMAVAQKQRLHGLLHHFVQAGEQRAQHMSRKMKQMDATTRSVVNMRIASEITHLSASAKKQLNALRLENKAAREQMKKEMMYAVKSAVQVAKQGLKQAVIQMTRGFAKLEVQQAAAHAEGQAARAAMAAKVKKNALKLRRMLADSVATQNRALLAYQAQTAAKLKKTNRDVTAKAKQMKVQAKVASAQMKAAVGTISEKIQAARLAAKRGVTAVGAANAARHAAALKETARALRAAEKRSNAKFGKLYGRLAKNRAEADRALSGATKNLNNALSRQVALEDARFAKTVKNLRQTQSLARDQMKQARKTFTTGLATAMSHIKQVESRIQGELNVVSGEVGNDKAAMATMQIHAKAELRKIIRLNNHRHSQSMRARGKLREVYNRQKRQAATAVQGLQQDATARILKLRRKLASYRRSAARRLSYAAKQLYGRTTEYMAIKAQKAATFKFSLQSAQTAAWNAVRKSRQNFEVSLVSMTNVMVASAKMYERNLARITKLKQNWPKASSADHHLLIQQQHGMAADLNKNLVRAVQLGESQMKAAIQRIHTKRNHLGSVSQAEVSSAMEGHAERAFRLVLKKRKQIATNYLNLKAYVGAAADSIKILKIGGKSTRLNALGDVLQTMVQLAHVKPKMVQGLGLGGTKLQGLFSDKHLQVHGGKSKVNGLVDEYVGVMKQCHDRWPMGLGRYLLSHLEKGMQYKGVLEVVKLEGRTGMWVILNSSTLGMGHSLPDLKKLAVRVNKFSAAVENLSAPSTQKRKVPFRAKPPEWQGN